MAISSRDERIVTVTRFMRSSKDGQWYWHTTTANNEPVGDGAEGYRELRKAVHGFFAQQGFDPITDPAQQYYSKLIKVSNREYHVYRYVSEVD